MPTWSSSGKNESFIILKPRANGDFRHRFKESKFLLIVAGTAVSCFPLFIPPYFIPIFTRSMGYSNEIAIVVLAGWNLASTVGRVLGGYTADALLGPLNSLIVCLLFIGLSSLVVWPLASSVGIFAIFLVFNGIGCGAFFSLVPPAIGAIMGPENTLGILPILWTTWFCGFFFVSTIWSDIKNTPKILTFNREHRSLLASTPCLRTPRVARLQAIDRQRIMQEVCLCLGFCFSFISDSVIPKTFLLGFNNRSIVDLKKHWMGGAHGPSIGSVLRFFSFRARVSRDLGDLDYRF